MWNDSTNAIKEICMQTGHELFVHGLKDMLDAEQQLVEALEENANEPSPADQKKAFHQHRKETEGQIERLQRRVEYLEEEPENADGHGIRRLSQEKKA